MIPTPDLTRRPRTRRVFSHEDMQRMAALYYDPAVPMHRVGAAFGVPASTLLRWVAEMDWPRRSARGGACVGPDAPAPDAPGRRLMTLDEKAQADMAQHEENLREEPELAAYFARKRTPSLLVTLRQASELARRELDAASQMRPETMADRERVAALVDRLSRALDRITKSLGNAQYNENWRRAMRKAR
jgi:transposase-like protein